MRVIENIARVRDRVAQHLAFESLFQELGFRVAQKKLRSRTFDFIDLSLGTGLNTETVPILFQQALRRQTLF